MMSILPRPSPRLVTNHCVNERGWDDPDDMVTNETLGWCNWDLRSIHSYCSGHPSSTPTCRPTSGSKKIMSTRKHYPENVNVRNGNPITIRPVTTLWKLIYPTWYELHHERPITIPAVSTIVIPVVTLP